MTEVQEARDTTGKTTSVKILITEKIARQGLNLLREQLPGAHRKIAQFLYWLLENKELRAVIDTIAKKAVLLLGLNSLCCVK